MAFHRSGSGVPGPLVAAGVLIAAGAVAVAAWMALQPETVPDSVGTDTLAAASAAAATTAAPEAVGATPESDTSTVAVDACRSQLQAGDALAEAAAASTADWTMHTQAQLKFDAGDYTSAQAKADWADSRSRGPAEVEAFQKASATWQAAGGGCEQMPASGADPALIDACMARATAQQQVAETGEVVNTQWSEHQTMMAGDHDSTYLGRWEKQVDDAESALAASKEALAALSEAPTC